MRLACIFMDAIKSESDFDISKWHYDDLSSYQTITLLLQSKRLNKLRFTPLPTTAYLSHLPSPTSSHNLSSNRFPKKYKEIRDASFFLQEIGRRITKAISECWNTKWYSYLYQYRTSFPDRYWLHVLLVKPYNTWRIFFYFSNI